VRTSNPKQLVCCLEVSTRYQSILRSNVNVMSSWLPGAKVVSLSKLSWRSVMKVGSSGMFRSEFHDSTLFQLRCWLIRLQTGLNIYIYIYTYIIQEGKMFALYKICKIINIIWLHLNLLFLFNITIRFWYLSKYNFTDGKRQHAILLLNR